MSAIWPTFKNEYLNRVAQALRLKSRSIRYSGTLTCEGGCEVRDHFYPDHECVRYGEKTYHPEDQPGVQYDRTEGMRVYYEPKGFPPSVSVDLMVWERCIHLELLENRRKDYGKVLLSLQHLKLKCDPEQLVELFKWTIHEVTLIDTTTENSGSADILKRIESRWKHDACDERLFDGSCAPPQTPEARTMLEMRLRPAGVEGSVS